MIRRYVFNLILLEEHPKSIFERVKRKFNFASVLSCIDEDYMLVLGNATTGSELRS